MDNKQLFIYGGIFAAGTGIGFGVGYIASKKKLQRQFEEDLESVRMSYSKSAKPKPDLGSIRDQVVVVQEEETPFTVISAEGYSSASEETDAELFRAAYGRVPSVFELMLMGRGMTAAEAVASVEVADIPRDNNDGDDVNMPEGNIFDNPQPDPDDIGEGEEEIPPYSVDRPNVISVEEWYANDTDYDQITLTYWADDDVLADDDKRMVNNVDEVVGATNLHRFGFRSNDADIVYVRNDRLKADYEITKDERNYAEVIHGIDPDEVNNSGVPRRMRSDDE